MKTNIITTCPFCGSESSITVEMVDLILWQAGKPVQNAFPYLSADEREQIISGICPTCWDKTFSVSEEEEDEDEEDYEDTFLEMDYNPYMGCYDYE